MLRSLRRRSASRLRLTAVLVSSAVAFLACGESPTAPLMVVASDVSLPANSTITHALSGSTFTFPAGAGVFSPSLAGQTLAVTFSNPTGSSTTATVSLSSPTGAALGSITANITFGSCIFAVAATTGTVGTVRVGDVITINPCNVSVNTAGQRANGVAQSRAVALVLGAAASNGVIITVGINPGGQLTLNGSAVGTVTLVPVSG